MNFSTVKIEKEDEDVIIGQSHFIKTVEDLYEALKNSSPHVKFGIAFCEASGKRLIRFDGNDETLTKRAIKNAGEIGAGHIFIIHLKDSFPINVIPHIRSVPEVLTLYAATSNELSVVVAEEGEKRGIVAVMDGERPKGLETEADKKERQDFLRNIGYKR
ncbi:MAG: adenosine-specific kinase [Thermoplasmatales archaeon]